MEVRPARSRAGSTDSVTSPRSPPPAALTLHEFMAERSGESLQREREREQAQEQQLGAGPAAAGSGSGCGGSSRGGGESGSPATARFQLSRLDTGSLPVGGDADVRALVSMARKGSLVLPATTTAVSSSSAVSLLAADEEEEGEEGEEASMVLGHMNSSTHVLGLALDTVGEGHDDGGFAMNMGEDCGDVCLERAKSLTLSHAASVNAELSRQISTHVEEVDPALHSSFQSLATLSAREKREASRKTLTRALSVRDEQGRQPFAVHPTQSTEEPFVWGRTFLNVLKKNGLRKDDRRLRETLKRLDDAGGPGARLALTDFMYVVGPSASLFLRTVQGQLVIPDFEQFREDLMTIFESARVVCSGHNANYIRNLADVDPEKYGVAVCTVDGQIAEFGDCADMVCLQGAVKPLLYMMAVEEHGLRTVHKYVGQEPSGLAFDQLALKPVEKMEGDDVSDGDGASDNARVAIPHNAMSNSGAIGCAALIGDQEPLSKRIARVLRKCRDSTVGRARVNASVFLAERDSACKNICLAYMMREQGSFPPGASMEDALDLYHQSCSIELDLRQLSVLGATMASGGMHPLTSERVFAANTVKAAMSSMLSDGMNTVSGEFAFRIGIPARSSASGLILGVIPGVGSVVTWSPRVDGAYNSPRGMRFFFELSRIFPIHQLGKVGVVAGRASEGTPTKATATQTRERLQQQQKGLSPATRRNNVFAHSDKTRNLMVHLLFAAHADDADELRALIAQGADVNQADYDNRTALHVAAAEGNLEACEFLVSQGANVNALDRWQRTPEMDAQASDGGEAVVALLLKSQTGNVPLTTRAGLHESGAQRRSRAGSDT